VLAQICQLYPDAELFALVDFLSDDDRRKLGDRRVRTSFLQHLPRAHSAFRLLLPLFPRAIESLDVSTYDLVISSSHAVAKGVRTHRGQLHVCYCYTPMRYAWDLQDQYLRRIGFDRGLHGFLAKRALARLRRWDRATSGRVDDFIAISQHIADRIRRCYGRDSTVIYPPVAIDAPPDSSSMTAARSVYVTVSQLVPYKRVDLIVEAFKQLPDRTLVVIGEGPERARIEAIAPANVCMLGALSESERDRWLREARAFVFAAEEDFGIAPVEAQAFGVPVIAFARGGALEIVAGLDDAVPTGVFFSDQTAEAIARAVREFERNEGRIRPQACRDNARRFAPARFRQELRTFIDARVQRFADQRTQRFAATPAQKPADGALSR